MHKIEDICERIEEAIKHEFNKGIQNVDSEEMGKVIDMYKDLMCAKKEYYEAKYYESIVEAMEEYGEEQEKGENGQRYYNGRRRDSMGRFTARRGRGSRGGRRGYEAMFPEYDDMEWERDMDREGMGRMYFPQGGSSGGSSQGSSSGNRGGSGSQGQSGGNTGGGRMNYDGEGQGQSRQQGGQQRDSREGRSGQYRKGYMESKELGRKEEMTKQELDTYMKELGSDIAEMVSNATPAEKQMLKQKLTEMATKVQ